MTTEKIYGRIESAQTKIGQKAGEYKVYVISGLSMSDFDKKNPLFPIGAEVEVTYETNDKGYKNIKSIMRIDSGEILPQPKNTEKKLEFPYCDALAEATISYNNQFNIGDVSALPLPEKLKAMECISESANIIYKFRNWQGV